MALNSFSPKDCGSSHHWRFLIFGDRLTIHSGESEIYHWRLLVINGRSPISSVECRNKNPGTSGNSSTLRYPSPANHCANHRSLPNPSPAANGSAIYAFWGG